MPAFILKSLIAIGAFKLPLPMLPPPLPLHCSLAYFCSTFAYSLILFSSFLIAGVLSLLILLLFFGECLLLSRFANTFFGGLCVRVSSVCIYVNEYFPFFSISIIFGNFEIQKDFDYIRCTAHTRQF